MRLRWTWKLGRVAGIDIRIHPSWLVIYGLIAWSAIIAARFFTPELGQQSTIVLGLIASLVLFASVVAHEFAHALVARRLGIPIGGITLFLFGGVATILNEPGSPADEMRIAIAGPALSVALAAIFFGLSLAASALNWLWGATLCFFLCFANASLAVFNLLPAFPSDGGRVLRAALWMWNKSQARATVWASQVSLVVALGLAIAGLYFVFGLHEVRGFWWIVIAAFLAQAAMFSARQARIDLALEQMHVADCMLKTLIPVPANTMVASFIGELAGRPGTGYPVVDQGALVGLADVRHTSGVPLALWNQTPMSSVMVPISRTSRLNGRDSARDALLRLHECGVDELPVYDGAELVGIITRESIFDRLHANGAHSRPVA
ncbi:MAG: site-2 protease family protein [Candidatus Eremiobacteraeota bacterium]|nr:site-2 protease family protein [Candidatus Eremiobacteraeota bacterium]